MREIKFRAWDGKQMSSAISLTRLVQGSPLEDIIKYTWLEYTGLKDKNGKEIFEGDIVEGNPLGSTGTRRGQVIWMNDGWYVSDETERDQEKRLHEDFFAKVEVLGNIYQNANLLGYEG